MIVIKDITIGYCIYLTLKDGKRYYGLRKMSRVNVCSKCFKIIYKNIS